MTSPANPPGQRGWGLLVLPAAFILIILLASFFASGWRDGVRLDPLLALPARLTVASVLAFALRRYPQALTAILGVGAAVAAADLILEALLATRMAWVQVAIAAALFVGLGCAVLALVRRWPQWSAAVVLPAMLTGLLLGGAVLHGAWRASPASHRTPLLMATSLPLSATSSAAQADILAGRARDAAALTALQRDFTVQLTAAPTAAQLEASRLLLAAHPPPLSPATLAAIDRWVRAGGRALILADAFSSWHPPHPLGDPRNPPVTSLLTPLLTHWGLSLDLDARDMGDATRVVMLDGDRLVLRSAGRLSLAAAPPDSVGCVVKQDVVAECAVGKGRVVIVSDADFLDGHLWQGERPWLDHAANVDWLERTVLSLADRPFSVAWSHPVWRKP